MFGKGVIPLLFRRNDRGATATEYLGSIVVVTAIVTALGGTGVGQQLAGGISAQICRLTGGSNCDSGKPGSGDLATDADYEPPLCQISSITDKAGAKAKILFIEWGQEYGFQEQRFKANTDVNKDGKVDDKDELVYVTFTDAASIAAKKDWKPGAKVGKFGADKVELGVGIKVTNGDTWVFESDDEAKRFRDDIEKLKMYDMRRKSPGGAEASVGDSVLYLFGKGPLKDEEETYDRVKKGLGGDRQITYGKLGLEASAAGGLKLSAGDEKKLSATLGGNFKFTPDVTWTDNKYKGTESYTYSSSIEYGTKVGYEAGPISGESSASTTQTGTITVTHDKKTGKLIRIDMTRTVEKGATKDGVKVGGDNGKKDDDKRGGSGGVKGTDNETGIEVVTNSVTFDPGAKGDADRAVAEEWLDGYGDNAAPFTYMFDDHAPTKRPGADDPFGQLLFDKGKSSKTVYTGQTDAAEYGFELNLGLSLGFSVSTEKKEEMLNDAQFLGAPRNDQRSYVPYSYCAK
jgi:Flp pilus assembly pilin Flp